jgi:hypothetical protein
VRKGILSGVVAAIILGSAPAAFAAEPLNQYVVEGDIGALAELGYDVTEAGGSGIVATPKQADDLRDRGFDVTPLGAESTAGAAAGLADPTWGYDVFRPYNLDPAPCQTTCSGAVDALGAPISLKQFYDLRAAQNPTLVKRVPYGTSRNGQELVAYRVTAGANVSAEGSKPGVMFHGAQHAREWISAEVVRRGFDHVLAHKDDPAIAAVLASTELWFIPLLNPDGYDYTFQSRASRLWRKTLRDNNDDGTISVGDGVDTNRNFASRWGYDDEGSSPSPAGRRPSQSPRCGTSPR